MHARLCAVILFFSVSVQAAEIRGKVVDVTGGEPLARVQVAILETGAEGITGKDGSFVIPDVAPGRYTLRLNAVSYRLVTVPFTLTADESEKEFDITLVPDNFRRTDTVEVKGDIFHGSDSPAVNEINLTSSEIRETSTVLADDPFRSIQALPGVSASGNNDFFAQFSVMGVPFEDVSTYINGILVPQPFHGEPGVNQGATLSILTSETIEDIKLLPAAYPEKYGDAVGAALDLQTRDGSRTPAIFRVSVGLADTELLGEGQLGHVKRGSWLASARKSYLGYLLRSRLNETFTDVSFYDGDLKLTYDLSPNQTVSFYGLGGHTRAELVHLNFTLPPGEFKRGTNDLILTRAGWRWAVNPHLLMDTRAAYIDAPFSEWDVNNQLLGGGTYKEGVAGNSLAWAWDKDHVLETGWTTRYARRDTPFDNQDFVFAGWRNDGYVQQSSSFFGNRLHVVGSLRLDTASRFEIHPVSPQVSASLQIAPSTEVQFGVGRYNQFRFPAFATFFAAGQTCVPTSEFLQTANHFTAGVERRIGESTRIRATFFDRQNQRVLARSGDCPLFPKADFSSQGQDYSRGVQLVLQSRSANRLSGWIGYTYTYASQDAAFLYLSEAGVVTRIFSPYYPTLEDQHHSLNVFGSYRLSPSVHVSGKWLYGSGFPVPSGSVDITKNPVQFIGLNATRIGDYQRLDVRAEKDWAFTRWKFVLYGEVLNLTNHNNPRFLGEIANSDGTFTARTQQGLPITPTAGVAFEF